MVGFQKSCLYSVCTTHEDLGILPIYAGFRVSKVCFFRSSPVIRSL